MILAGASLDDIIVITLFTLFLGLAKGDSIGIYHTLLMIPRSLALGIIPGIGAGFLLVWFFDKFFEKIHATEKVILLIGVSIILTQIGEWAHTAALLGVMTIGFIFLAKADRVAKELSLKLENLWIFSEIVLFVLIGMSVDVRIALQAGPLALLLIVLGLLARSIGVILATHGSKLNPHERLFSVIAYLPKATVQAALGALPLQAGIAGGELILAYAVTAIIFSAPLGLIGIRLGGKNLLSNSSANQ